MRGFTALVNPISGGGRAPRIWEPIARTLRASGAEVVTVSTRGAAHAMEAAAQAPADHVVVAVGGDGLVRDVAGGVAVTGGTMAIVPAGRGNDLARLWRIPTAPEALAGMLRDGTAHGIDLLDVNGVIAPGNVYIGIDAVSTRIINANRRIPAHLLYRLAPVRAIASWRPPTFTVTTDGERWQGKAHTVVVANSGSYGHGLRIVPPAVVDDGLAHVLVVGDAPRTALAAFMRQAKHGTHLARPEVSVRAAREIVVDADRPVPVCADGDEVTELPATVRLRDNAITVVRPD